MPRSEEFLTDLYRTQNQDLMNFARRRVGGQEAEDVVQDSYLHLLQKGEFDALRHPRGYLYRIASNLAVDLKRKNLTRSRFFVTDLEFDQLVPDSRPDCKSDEGIMEIMYVRACLERLTPRCRRVFVLSRLYGMTYPEIAAELGVSLRTVDRCMIKATEYLNKRFGR